MTQEQFIKMTEAIAGRKELQADHKVKNSIVLILQECKCGSLDVQLKIEGEDGFRVAANNEYKIQELIREFREDHGRRMKKAKAEFENAASIAKAAFVSANKKARKFFEDDNLPEPTDAAYLDPLAPPQFNPDPPSAPPPQPPSDNSDF